MGKNARCKMAFSQILTVKCFRHKWIVLGILLQIISIFIPASDANGIDRSPRFDGWYNNLDNPKWGSIGQGLSRITFAAIDGLERIPRGTSLPNPRTLSRSLLRGKSGIASTNRSALFAFFGQHLSDDLLDSRRVRCPNQYMNVVIPQNESTSTMNLDISKRILPIYRSKYLADTGTSGNLPRTLVNDATAWMDGSVIYGNSFSWSQNLRSFVDGKLQSESNKGRFPERNRKEIPLMNPIVDRSDTGKKRNPADSFSFGNPRGNENPFLMSIGILWFRYHNHLAKKFKTQNPKWTDEQLFNEARKWTVATYQNIAAYQWLPILTGRNLSPYKEYNPNLDPGVSSEFAIAAMRVGHSLVPSGIVLRKNDSNCSDINPLPPIFGRSAGEPALRLCNSYWQLQTALQQHGIDSLILGMALQKAEKTDNIVVEDLSEYLYGSLKRSRMDLETLTIVRGRDAGLPSYNSARLAYNLEPLKNFSHLNPDLSEGILKKLKEEYVDINQLELYVGGLLEARDDVIGNLFATIIMDQFRRTRDSDRFWFENTKNRLFTQAQINTIRSTTMRDVIADVTGIPKNKLQDNVFTVSGTKCPITNSTIQFKQNCTPNEGYNFFKDQWGIFIGTVILIILFPTLSFLIMRWLAWKRQQHATKIRQKIAMKTAEKASTKMSAKKKGKIENRVFTAQEIESKHKMNRVVVELESKEIRILTISGNLLRSINLSKFEKSNLFVSNNKKKDLLVIRVPKEYDVVLRLASWEERKTAITNLQDFMEEIPLATEIYETDEKELLKGAITKEARQELLEAFFRRVFATALNIESTPEDPKSNQSMSIFSLELTQLELAETLGMKPDSLFVQQIFQLADVDNSGYLSYTEFADLIILLTTGTPEQKAKMLFDIYDVKKTGHIDRQEANAMIRSFLEMADVKLPPKEIDNAVETMFRETGIENKTEISLEDFQYIMLKEHRDSFEQAQLSLPGVTKSIRRKLNRVNDAKCKMPLKRLRTHLADDESSVSEHKSNAVQRRKNTNDKTEKTENAIYSEPIAVEEEKRRLLKWWKNLKRTVENYRSHILCMVIFYSITIALIVERALYYAYGSENLGIRRVTEWGIIISRSTAAGMSFHFSFILLTMSRNLITFCRETFLKNYIPFDSAVAFHKQIAIVALIESILHTFGHLSNFYHISIHPLPVVACLFPSIIVDDGSDLPPKITSWLFATITGLTGLLLLLTLSIIYTFAIQFSRRFCFQAFWMTHHLYVLLYVLIILHGSMGLVQAPRYHLFLIGPFTIFVIDKLITISRSKLKIAVVKAEPLPSNVLNLVFQRPTAFDYKSGQWVRIACLPLGESEYHPFTLTSAPHERHLSLHIRAAGPWTTNLRLTYKSALDTNEKLPVLYLDGPFGEGHQDWYKYEVSVLVSAGIGVTPFASILKDIVHRSRSTKGFQVTCKKVYFIWVTRTQKQFEWLTDIIRDLEGTKGGDLVSTHIYITQFSNQFDLRTTLLYICERNFQKVANKSMFTGLKAITHFGRPQFNRFLDSLQMQHKDVRTIGVFSCGPAGLTSGVESSCRDLNKLNKARFNHFYENF